MRDVHTHSAFSYDSDCPMEQMIQGAIDKKLDGICFTEHMDIDYPYKEEFVSVDLAGYFKSLNELKEKYKNKIDVCSGIEVGMMEGTFDRYHEIISENDFDFCIGSVHVSCGRDPYFPNFLEGRNPKDAYAAYFSDTLTDIKSFDDFDTLAHLDYFTRYADPAILKWVYDDNIDTIKRIFDVIISKDKSLEVNTAGLKKGSRDFNPPMRLLCIYFEMGGHSITIGSDAHRAEDIAFEFDKVKENLRDIGCSNYDYYQKRCRIREKL